MIKKLHFALLSSIFGLGGCGIIYTNVKVPRAYRSSTPNEVRAEISDKTVSGQSCNRSLLFLVAWGDASYAAAAQNALASNADSVLYDVKSDMEAFSVLGLYTRTCTILTGKVGRIK